MERQKPELELRLEGEGWKWLTNEDCRFSVVSGNNILADSVPTRSDSDIEQDYLGKGFSRVRVENAYDCDANPIPGFRAVYVKGAAYTARRLCPKSRRSRQLEQ